MREFETKVTCPRCGKEWTAQQGESEVDCNCHTYCEDGDKPSDCTLEPYTLNHEVGFPFGVHTGSIAHDDSPFQIQYYCTIHQRYGYKIPITIPVTRQVGRVKKKYRLIESI